MKRWLGVAGLGGLTVLSVIASPTAASAAPGGGKAEKAPGGASAPAVSNRPGASQAAAPAKGNPNPGKGNPNPAKGNANPGKGNPGKANPGKGNPGKSNPGKANGHVKANNGQVRRNGPVKAQAAAATASTTAAAAAPVVAAPAASVAAKVTICHATNSETSPFELITVPDAAVQAHVGNHGDIAPVNGVCPSAITPPAPGEPVTICHRTNSDTNPFEVITIPDAALPAHIAHGDVATVNGECPGPVIVPPPVVLGGTQVPGTRVLGVSLTQTERATVRAQSVSEAVPAARTGRFSARTSTGGERAGTLPATGTDVASTVLVGLLLLLVGGRMARSGKVRMTSPSGAISANIARPDPIPSHTGLRSLRSNAPPGSLRRLR